MPLTAALATSSYSLSMRFVWLIFVGLLMAMVAVLPRLNQRRPAVSADTTHPTAAFPAGNPSLSIARAASFRSLHGLPDAATRPDSVVAFGLAQRGVPYLYAGISPLTGFDCSGFIRYTFAHFKVDVPHSTALLIDVGQPVPRADAQPGDIVVFTGTATTSITPGHAGIVVSEWGQLPLRFVHASSARRESGVKVSQVEGTDYERRFMQVRRVLTPSTVIATHPRPAGAVARIAALPAKPVAVVPEVALGATLPRVLTPILTAKKKPAKASAKYLGPVKKKKSVKTTAGHKAKAIIQKKLVVSGNALAKPAPSKSRARVKSHQANR